MMSLARPLSLIVFLFSFRSLAAEESAKPHVVKGAEAVRLISALQDAGIRPRREKSKKAYIQQAKSVSCLLIGNGLLDAQTEVQMLIPSQRCTIDKTSVDDNAKAKALVGVMTQLKIMGDASMGQKVEYLATNVSCLIDMTIEAGAADSAEGQKRFVCTLTFDEDTYGR
jgi:hypothetical protein